jgi:CRISPR-associated endonuclease Cas2
MSERIKRQIQKRKLIKSAKSITEVFLEGVYGALELFGALQINRCSMYSSMRKNAFSDWTDTRFSRQVNDAVKVGYLKVSPSNSIEFTDKARLRIIDSIVSGKRNDGKYRFISFDIPEDKRAQRDGFRRAIKRMGFKQIQKSLWACDKNIGDFIEVAKKEYKVEKYVAYIISEKSDIDNYIKKTLKKH